MHFISNAILQTDKYRNTKDVTAGNQQPDVNM